MGGKLKFLCCCSNFSISSFRLFFTAVPIPILLADTDTKNLPLADTDADTFDTDTFIII